MNLLADNVMTKNDSLEGLDNENIKGLVDKL